MARWQKVYTTTEPYRAEIVKSVLENKGLEPVMFNKKDSAYLFGHIEIHVEADQVLRACKIIRDEISFEA